MSDVQRVVKQWLETDAALGVAEVPIAKIRRSRTAAIPVPTPVPMAVAAARQMPPHPAPVHTPVAARPKLTPQPAHVPTLPGVPDPMAKRKPVIEMPPPPAGNIADLPPLTRAQKEEALQQLLAETLRASAPYINEVATKLVFGEGDPDAQILFVGEGPGTEEDRTGRPFVGRSGQLLDKMIGAMGFKRDEKMAGIYIANVVKLRCADPDENGRLKDRPPTPEEAARGLPTLHRQIEIIRPRVIVTLGAPAIKYITGTTEGVMKIRGTWMQYRDIPVMPTYHPSFVLRAYTEENRRKVWGDLQLALSKIRK